MGISIQQKRLKCYIICSIAIMLLALLSITTRSLWLDECSRCSMAATGDLKGAMEFGLECAQPLYIFLIYLWSFLFSGVPSEFALRSMNLVFVVFCILSAIPIVEKKNWPAPMLLLFFFHPMFTYYMNEATPYIILYATALAFIYSVFYTENFNSVGNIIRINLIFIWGVLNHFLFGFIILMYFAKCFVSIRKNKKLILRHAGIMLAFGIIYIPVLLVYLSHLDGSQTGFSLRNLLYIIYSFLGMAGLGLSRSDLRAGNFYNLTPVMIALCVLFAIIAIIIFIMVITHRRSFLRKNKILLIGACTVMIPFIIVAIFKHFGMWERHLMFLLPVYVIVFGDMLLEVCTKRSIKIAFAAIFTLMFISAANLRFNDYYARSNMRGIRDYAVEQFAKNDHLTIISDVDFAYYDIAHAATGPDQHFIGTWKKGTSYIRAAYEEALASGNDVILIISEHYSSHKLYTGFDDNPDYTVDSSIAGFKIIQPVR